MVDNLGIKKCIKVLDRVLIKYIKNNDVSHVIVDNTFKVGRVDVKGDNMYFD